MKEWRRNVVMLAGFGVLPIALVGEPVIAFAGPPPNVARITVDGMCEVPAATIRDCIRSKKGKPYDETTVRADVGRIMRMQKFVDASADFEDVAGKRILHFRVIERSTPRQVEPTRQYDGPLAFRHARSGLSDHNAE